MALYTIELNQVLKHYNIFNFPYEIYDEKKRREFEEAFERHFYFREIGCDTPEKFIWYLRDKMTTVFPYYNELMRTATIEYDVENPYNLTETYTRKIDTKGKSAGFASSVGRAESSQGSETKETRSIESIGSVKVEGSNSDTENTKTDSQGVENTNTSATKTETQEGSGTSNNVKKFLDTPQGKLNLDNTDYLTNLTQDEGNSTNNQSNEASESGTSERNSEGTSETLRTLNGSSEQNTSSNGSETNEGNTSVKASGEERTTADSNTRTERMDNQVEEYTMTRKGNIGVNPASYEIDHHINTQKTLKRIYEMFFEECEDLFMMVY